MESIHCRYALNLYVKHTSVCRGENRHNDMIVMYTVMSALPVSCVCGTVFKFILRPCYIRLVGSVTVNGHQNVSEIFP
jgi:hypothetical protein